MRHEASNIDDNTITDNDLAPKATWYKSKLIDLSQGTDSIEGKPTSTIETATAFFGVFGPS